MIQTQSQQSKLAVLIDADNVAPAYAEKLFSEVAKYGTATIKRAYGDWTTPNLTGWKNILNQFAIQPIQQDRDTVGKNATDIAMIIDAMDLLYSAELNGFCLVSSDSDFTRLATRLRESRLTVYGFGEQKTPQPFVVACEKFIKILPTPPLFKTYLYPLDVRAINYFACFQIKLWPPNRAKIPQYFPSKLEVLKSRALAQAFFFSPCPSCPKGSIACSIPSPKTML